MEEFEGYSENNQFIRLTLILTCFSTNGGESRERRCLFRDLGY